ncbi:Heat shock transcription factor [Paraconiothyrium brasiliense]|uniref:Heat shock transcription factor n=1 Tax=Paraconiothyrium brasiliense TaxID=300254 RepID=A0ABR3RV91_9PLEO
MGGFGDGAFYDQLGGYGANFSQQPSTHSRVVSLDGLNDGTDLGAGQLVRRNQNQQLAARGRSPWGFNEQGQSGAWENTDDDEELERKAAIAKKDASAKRKTIPPFVQKLSSFLDNGNNTNLIRWSDDGNSFIVLDEDEFARTLIPELFKHNNYASFVRQLNMYGFHKKVGLSDNSMKASETKAKAPSEYFNRYFKRGRPELLWLIQKPKNVPAGPKRKRDDDTKGDSDEERKYAPDGGGGGYVEELAVRGNNEGMAMIPRAEYNSLRAEVRTLQQQQKVISNVLGQIRRQNDQLYQQATAFQTLHDRHENSINAILTFLATFYNRSLEGNTNNINIADMFGAAMGNQQPQGTVVDMENYPEVPIAQSPQMQKRTPMKLLPAPPARKVESLSPRARTVSPTVRTAATTPLATPNERPATTFQPGMPQSRTTARPTNTRPTFNVPLKVETNPSSQDPMSLPENHEIMSAIQNANAHATAGGYSQAPQIDLPAALNSYQHQAGQTPLTTQQRNDVLSLMAHNTSAASPNSAFAANTNNALNNPQPPPMPNLDQLQETEAQLAYLQRVSEEQNSRVQSLQERLQPLSPSGQIPGLDANNSYFGNTELGDPGSYDLDLDSFVQDNDFFPSTTQGDGIATADPTLPDLNYTLSGDNSGFGDANASEPFNFGGGDGDHLGVKDAAGGTVESVSSSATSPASATVEEVEDESRKRSPKRRRK